MAAALPKRHLVAVTRRASEFRLLVFYTLWYKATFTARVASVFIVLQIRIYLASQKKSLPT